MNCWFRPGDAERVKQYDQLREDAVDSTVDDAHERDREATRGSGEA
jgi:hypothetical protein